MAADAAQRGEGLPAYGAGAPSAPGSSPLLPEDSLAGMQGRPGSGSSPGGEFELARDSMSLNYGRQVSGPRNRLSSWGSNRASRASAEFSPPRVVDRSRPLGQSQGRYAVKRVKQQSKFSLPLMDPFHSLVHHSTVWITAFFCFSYLCTHLVFAFIYSVIDESCDLRIKSYLDAFYLSIEVGMTVGWGLPGGNAYFKQDPKASHGCYSAAVFILLHTLFMHVQNAALIGILYCRISRGTSRATSLIFSERAVIREIGGRVYMMFQVCETRKHQLASARVRCYALLWREDGDGASQFEQRAMRLTHPDDELGGNLLLTFPCVVVHEIDAWSPLAPAAEGIGFPQLMRRAADRDDPPPGPSRLEVEAFMQTTRVEVIALVEGEEPVTSCTTQARHSYVNEDFAFGYAFAPAVTRESSGEWTIWYEKLQELVPAGPTARESVIRGQGLLR